MITHPLEELTLDQLRSRTSLKWRTHPSDVLPLWVAEMDVMQAPAVSEALIRAIENGDTGYPAGNSMGETISSFAADPVGGGPRSTQITLPSCPTS